MDESYQSSEFLNEKQQNSKLIYLGVKHEVVMDFSISDKVILKSTGQEAEVIEIKEDNTLVVFLTNDGGCVIVTEEQIRKRNECYDRRIG